MSLNDLRGEFADDIAQIAADPFGIRIVGNPLFYRVHVLVAPVINWAISITNDQVVGPHFLEQFGDGGPGRDRRRGDSGRHQAYRAHHEYPGPFDGCGLCAVRAAYPSLAPRGRDPGVRDDLR